MRKMREKNDENHQEINTMKPMYPNYATYDITHYSPRNYIAEAKHEGIRMIITKIGGRARLWVEKQDRQMQEKTRWLPHIISELEGIKEDNFLLDTEAIAITDGKEDLQAMAEAIGMYSCEIPKDKKEIIIHAFDMLISNGRLIENKSLMERKSALADFFKRNNPLRNLKEESYTDDLPGLYSQAKQEGYKGVVLKEKDGFYHPGKTRNTWLKKEFKTVIKAQVRMVIANNCMPSAVTEYGQVKIPSNFSALATMIMGKPDIKAEVIVSYDMLSKEGKWIVPVIKDMKILEE